MLCTAAVALEMLPKVTQCFKSNFTKLSIRAAGAATRLVVATATNSSQKLALEQSIALLVRLKLPAPPPSSRNCNGH